MVEGTYALNYADIVNHYLGSSWEKQLSPFDMYY